MHMNNSIIAEIGSVHDGSLGNALKLVDLAKECGADVAKFQLHIAEYESTIDAPSPGYFRDEERFDYFNRIAFTKEEWKLISDHCKDVGIKFMCSPFSLEALDLLLEISVDAIKIASGELTNHELIEKSINSLKPVYISTGMSNYGEINAVINLVEKSGFLDNIVLMQCSSLYPCPIDLCGVNIVSEFKSKFGVKLGFSDHTNSNSAAIISAYLGANFIEKHLTFSNLMYGSDAKYAYVPDKFKTYVSEIRDAWEIRDNPVDKNNLEPYLESRRIFQKSLTLKSDLRKGTVLTRGDLTLKKPGVGIPFSGIDSVIGKRLLQDFKADYQIKLEDLS